MYSYFGEGEFFDQEETRKYSAQCASQESEVFFIDKDVMIYLIEILWKFAICNKYRTKIKTASPTKKTMVHRKNSFYFTNIWEK